MKQTTTDKQTVKREPEYTLDDVGCYIDGARGIYAIDAIQAFALSHGFPNPATKPDLEEFANEVEDEIDDYMNDNYGIDGASWGRSEQGDWGLWTNDEE